MVYFLSMAIHTIILKILLPVFSLFSTSGNHDIHISKCEIQYNEESESFEVATQIYLDDFQKSMSQNGIPDLQLFTSKELKDADKYIIQYLTKKLVITTDGNSLSGTFIGKEQSEDLLAIWCYTEYKSPSHFKQLKIKYDALMDIYDDQRNIINIKAKGKKGYALLHSKHIEEVVNF